MVAQAPDLPIHLGSMPDAVRAVVAVFGADAAEATFSSTMIHTRAQICPTSTSSPAFHDGELLAMHA